MRARVPWKRVLAVPDHARRSPVRQLRVPGLPNPANSEHLPPRFIIDQQVHQQRAGVLRQGGERPEGKLENHSGWHGGGRGAVGSAAGLRPSLRKLHCAADYSGLLSRASWIGSRLHGRLQRRHLRARGLDQPRRAAGRRLPLLGSGRNLPHCPLLQHQKASHRYGSDKVGSGVHAAIVQGAAGACGDVPGDSRSVLTQCGFLVFWVLASVYIFSCG